MNRVPDHPWEPSPDATLSQAIREAMGSASMAWERVEGAGVFDADMALWVSQGLEAWLRDRGTSAA